MSDENQKFVAYGGGGVGFSSLLGIAFIVLKLCGVIDWSWWWVLAPIWIPLSITVVIGIILLVFYLIIWHDL